MSSGTEALRSARAPETLRIKCAGVTLVADAWGDRDDPPVVFLHGGGQTRHAWGGAARALAERGRYALSLDLRGHGESDWAPDGDYQITSFAADVYAVSDHLGTPPALVGASLGGMSAMLAVGEATEPAAVASAAVFVDVVPRLEPEGVERIGGFMLAHIEHGFDSLEAAAAVVKAYTPERTREVNLDGLKKNLRLGEDGRWRWHWDPAFMTLRGEGRGIEYERLEAAVRRISVPTLLVRGRMSDMVGEQGVAEFLEAVPHAKYVDVSDAGHMVAGDRNDVFSDAVVTFLDEAFAGRQA